MPCHQGYEHPPNLAWLMLLFDVFLFFFEILFLDPESLGPDFFGGFGGLEVFGVYRLHKRFGMNDEVAAWPGPCV